MYFMAIRILHIVDQCSETTTINRSCLHHQKQHINTPEQNTLSSITTALHIHSSEITGLLFRIVWTLLSLPLLSP